jgi:ABC-2 type transport system permease protein
MRNAVELNRASYYFDIIKNLIVRDIKVKYKRSFLGFLWTLINPLVMAAIYIFVFSTVLRPGVSKYWAFLISGFFAWNFFALALTSGSDAIHFNKSIVTKVYLPHEILVLSSTLSKLIEFLFELAIIVPIIAYFHLGRLPLSLSALPLMLLIQLLLALGLALPLCCLRVFYKDVEQIIPLMMTGWFFLTPIVYTTEMVPKQYLPYIALNPMSAIISAYHDIFYLAKFPETHLVLNMSLSAVVIFTIGYAIFNRYKRTFAEIV